MTSKFEELFEKYNYPSLNKFKQILKAEKIDTNGVDKFIKEKSVLQIHKPVIEIKEKQKFIFSLNPFDMVQMDLLDYQKYSRQNKGYKYILIVVDIFTRLAYAEPIKDKTPLSVLNAFKKFNIQCVSVFHDSGNEYQGKFLEYLNDNDIVNLKAEIGDHHSLGIIDRFSRTLKTIIAKYMTVNNTTKYYDKLSNIISAYNKTPHSSLGDVSPDSVLTNKEHYEQVSKINIAKLVFNKSLQRNKNKIAKGNYVRIKIKKKEFQKGYEITFTKEIYEVVEVVGEKAKLSNGKTYKLDVLLLANKEAVDTSEIDKANNELRLKRKLRKEGLDDEYDIRYWEKPK